MIDVIKRLFAVIKQEVILLDDGHLWYWIITIIFLLFACFFSLGFWALENSNEISSAKDEEPEDDSRTRMQKKKPAMELLGINAWLCGVTSAVLAFDALFTTFFFLLMGLFPTSMLLSVVLSVLVTVLIVAGITVLVGYEFPKLVGEFYGERLGRRLQPALTFFCAILWPVSALIRGVGGLLSRLCGVDPSMAASAVTEEEIRQMVETGSEIGFIEESQKEMINNIFAFDDTTAGEVMTHRTELIAVEKNAEISEVVYLAVNEGFSRLPIYEEDIDDIIGLIYVKDLLSLVGCQSLDSFHLSDFIRPILYVPESTRCRELFAQFKKNKINMAVVVDEYGGTDGIVTMEDVLESIVGDIEDEYDEQSIEIQKISDSTYIMLGAAELDEVGEELQISFEKDGEDFDTLGGFITHVLGYVPQESEHAEIEHAGYRFTVLVMDERRVDKVRVQKLPKPEAAEKTE